MPLGIVHPRHLKQYAQEVHVSLRANRFANVQRPYFVGDAIQTDWGPMNGPRKEMVQEAISKLPPGAYTRISKAPDGPKFNHTTEFSLSHRQYWYWRFTALSRFVLSPPGAGLDCYRHAQARACVFAYAQLKYVQHSARGPGNAQHRDAARRGTAWHGVNVHRCM